MESRWIEVPKSARYHLAGELGPRTDELWYLLHGYGELAAGFLAGFAPAARPGRLLVAPEGLSRYYRRGGGGAIGASWMTKEDREREIADYVGFLDRLQATLSRELGPARPRVGVLGFSQGTATACRWVALGQAFEHEGPARLALWGSGVPPDLDLERLRARLAGVAPVFVAGSGDPALDDERLAAECERLASHGLEGTVVRYDGGHEIAAAALPPVFDLD